MPHVRRFRLFATAVIAVCSLAACGFVGARDKSSLKPNGFVLFGHAAVALPTSDHRANGTACNSPVTDITPGTSVKVLDPAGQVLGQTYLGNGIIGRDNSTPTCNFPFSISGVPGGVDTYGVAIGARSPQPFPAATLRQNNAAVITITS